MPSTPRMPFSAPKATKAPLLVLIPAVPAPRGAVVAAPLAALIVAAAVAAAVAGAVKCGEVSIGAHENAACGGPPRRPDIGLFVALLSPQRAAASGGRVVCHWFGCGRKEAGASR